MPSLPITTRLDKETIEKLEKLADATKRSKSFLVAEAVGVRQPVEIPVRKQSKL